MGESGFIGRALQTGARALTPNLLLIVLGAVASAAVASLQLKSQMDGLDAMASRDMERMMAASNGATLLVLLGLFTMFAAWMATLYGAHASSLYEDAPRGIGFAHLSRPDGGFWAFVWRNILLALWCALLMIPIMIVLGILAVLLRGQMFMMRILMSPSLQAVIGLFVISIIALLTARYSLVLPATVAGDLDCSLKGAVQRVQGRFWPLAITIILVMGASGIASYAIGSLFGINDLSLQGIGADPEAGMKTMLEAARRLKENPAILWGSQFLAQLIAMCSSVFTAAALSTAYSDSKREETRASVF